MVSIMIIYAVMVFNNIWLGIGTSMFASIAIGLGVDFAFILWIESSSSQIIENIEDVILAYIQIPVEHYSLIFWQSVWVRDTYDLRGSSSCAFWWDCSFGSCC